MTTDFGRCPICGEYGFLTGRFADHKCKPAWECRLETEDDDSWGKVYARDPEEAAEKYAERYDCEGGEYAIVSSRIVLVRKPSDFEEENTTAIERFSVEGEAVPQYHATKIEQEAAQSAE